MTNAKARARATLACGLLWTAAMLVACGGSTDAADEAAAEPSAPPPASEPFGSATLSWDAVVDDTVSGYRVYHGQAAGSYAQAPGEGANAGTATSFVVAGLQKGVTYYFTVTSVDTQGRESVYSNEVSKLIR